MAPNDNIQISHVSGIWLLVQYRHSLCKNLYSQQVNSLERHDGSILLFPKGTFIENRTRWLKDTRETDVTGDFQYAHGMIWWLQLWYRKRVVSTILTKLSKLVKILNYVSPVPVLLGKLPPAESQILFTAVTRNLCDRFTGNNIPKFPVPNIKIYMLSIIQMVQVFRWAKVVHPRRSCEVSKFFIAITQVLRRVLL